jgi:hypothetical protein
MSRGGQISAYATHWSDPTTWLHALPGAGPAQGRLPTRPDAEDPFIWQDEDDNWHALLHNLEGAHMCSGLLCQVGVHGYSLNGYDWFYGGTVYTNHVTTTTNGTLVLNRRERPHVVFAEGTRTPVALSNSAELSDCGRGCGDRSFTLVQAIV